MTDTDHVAPHDEPGPADHGRSTAWVALAAVAVAVPFGRWASTALVESRGYDPEAETEPPGLALLSYLLMGAIVLPPAALAIRNGLRSWRAGHLDAIAVLVLAALVGAVVLLGLPVLLSRFIGWPLVAAVTVGLVVAGWVTQRWGWGHMGRSGPIGSG